MVKSTNGDQFLVLRPLLVDYVMSMPRGAQVDLPQGRRPDRARGRHLPRRAGAGGRRRFRGADVLAAARRRARGHGDVLRACARTTPSMPGATSTTFFGERPPNWDLVIADVADYDGPGGGPGRCWTCWRRGRCSTRSRDALVAGGVLMIYVATVTQLSRTVEALREQQCWTEPRAWESMQRGWDVVGSRGAAAAHDARPHRVSDQRAQAGAGRGRRRCRCGASAASRLAGAATRLV